MGFTNIIAASENDEESTESNKQSFLLANVLKKKIIYQEHSDAGFECDYEKIDKISITYV